MKTPSSLALLLLFAALPAAAADLKPGERCQTDFLKKVVGDFKAGAIVSDERIVTRSANGMTIPVLKFGEPKTCDSGTWRFLASGTPLVWRNADAGRLWDTTNAGPNASVVLVADDFFKKADPAALKVLAAADAVIEAGVQLGLVTVAESPKPLAELLKGASGGAFGILKPKILTPVAADKQTANIPPEQFGAVFRKLLDETGAAKAGGSAVMDFRLAVLALNAEIGRLGVTAADGITLPVLHLYLPGLPKDYLLPKTDKATALDDVKFGVALEALTGKGVTPALDDSAPRAGSLLEPVDLGLRNLIAIRAAQVEQIVAAAKPRLKGKTITQMEVATRTAGEASKQPANSLSAEVVKRLAESREYQQLDAMYENKKAQLGDAFTKGPDGIAMAKAREDMLAAARSATVETAPDGTKTVVYTQNGKKVALTSVVPSAVEGNAAVRSDVAGMISRFIVDGAKADAQNAAMWAAIGGAGQPGVPLDTGLTGGERDLAKNLPPETKKVKAGAAGCDNPKDLIRNDYETYAARQRAAAAAMAGGNVKSRNDVEKARLEQLAAADVVCQKEKADAQGIKQDYFDDPAIAKGARERALADAESRCAAAKKAVDDAAQAKIAELAKGEAGDRDPAKLRAKADADLTVGFYGAVLTSANALRAEYTTAASPRLKKLSLATGNSPKLTAFTKLWFDKEWPQDESRKAELQAAVAACAKDLGLGDASDSPSYRNPENPDNLDKHCKINEKLSKYIADSKGSNVPVP